MKSLFLCRIVSLATVLTCCLPGASSLSGAKLTGRWGFNDTTTPYTDSSGNADGMTQDPATAAAGAVGGVDGNAVGLAFQASPGVASRLCGYGAALQTDSFGFAFWINPVNLNSGDNFIGKEMAATTSGDAYSRLAWQVHLGADNGKGAAPLEFLVRGTNRAGGNYFGNVLSSVTLPLHLAVTHWYHVAGGYNAVTGKLVLFVDAVGIESTNGVPGARNSDGSALVVGTIINGTSYVTYAGVSNLDDLQIYDGPSTAQEVAFLLSNPGLAIGETYPAAAATGNLVAHWTLDDAASPFLDASGNGNLLARDVNTASPQSVAGVNSTGTQLTWEAAPGAATRLCTYNGTVQNDSFGFAFWVHPVSMSTGDNLIGKEMPATSSGNAFERAAWQVHVGADNGAGAAPLEFLVRGNDGSKGNFFRQRCFHRRAAAARECQRVVSRCGRI